MEPEPITARGGAFMTIMGGLLSGGGRDYLRSYWRGSSTTPYYFNTDGYALKGWQMIGGKDYYFEPRAGHPLEMCHVCGARGEQHIGKF